MCSSAHDSKCAALLARVAAVLRKLCTDDDPADLESWGEMRDFEDEIKDLWLAPLCLLGVIGGVSVVAAVL